MKKLVTDPDKCIGCKTCEIMCSNAFFKAPDKEKSAIRVNTDDSGGFVISVCDQCGICVEMCQTMALRINAKGVVMLDKKKCVGCLVCVGECLRGFMRYHDDLPTPFKCNACGICAAECPKMALTIVEEVEDNA